MSSTSSLLLSTPLYKPGLKLKQVCLLGQVTQVCLLMPQYLPLQKLLLESFVFSITGLMNQKNMTTAMNAPRKLPANTSHQKWCSSRVRVIPTQLAKAIKIHWIVAFKGNTRDKPWEYFVVMFLVYWTIRIDNVTEYQAWKYNTVME